jgi:putative MFS transporter
MASPPRNAELSNPRARRFLRRVTLVTSGGMFLDGYVFAVVAVTMALQTFKTDLGVSSAWAGLISASTLIGIFVGSVSFGYLTDRIGRRWMFLANLAAFAAASLLLYFVRAPEQMFLLGLVLGLAIGADYAIGPPLLSEFAPTAVRGRTTAVLEIGWNLGYVLAYLVGYLVTSAHPHQWRLVLASAVVPAVLCLVLRHGLPESPRWLLSKGRRAEAEQVLDQLGWSTRTEDFEGEEPQRTRMRALLSPAYLGRTVFACGFWTCLVLPYFAISFFQADVFEAIGLSDPVAEALMGTVLALLGVFLGWSLVERVGRRNLLIVPLWISAVALLAIGLDGVLPKAFIALFLFLYLFAYGVSSTLCGVYPEEVFPTALRTTGVGLGARPAASGRRSGPSCCRWCWSGGASR